MKVLRPCLVDNGELFRTEVVRHQTRAAKGKE